jgi:hypothetical protein
MLRGPTISFREIFHFLPLDIVWNYNLPKVLIYQSPDSTGYNIFTPILNAIWPVAHLMSIAWLLVYFWPTTKLQPRLCLIVVCYLLTLITAALHAGLRLISSMLLWTLPGSLNLLLIHVLVMNSHLVASQQCRLQVQKVLQTNGGDGKTSTSTSSISTRPTTTSSVSAPSSTPTIAKFDYTNDKVRGVNL